MFFRSLELCFAVRIHEHNLRGSPDLKDKVFYNIAENFLSHKFSSALDIWHVVMTQLRKFLRGYGANKREGQKEKEIFAETNSGVWTGKLRKRN
jgi:hypothetical protein